MPASAPAPWNNSLPDRADRQAFSSWFWLCKVLVPALSMGRFYSSLPPPCWAVKPVITLPPNLYLITGPRQEPCISPPDKGYPQVAASSSETDSDSLDGGCKNSFPDFGSPLDSNCSESVSRTCICAVCMCVSACVCLDTYIDIFECKLWPEVTPTVALFL